MYSNGYFWDLADRRTGDDGILGILEGEQALASALDEKGKPNSTGRWPSDSVFGVIENILVPKTFTPRSTFLICTDLSAEIADFIAYDDDAVAFIHAKATKKTNKKTKISSGSELSAGAFHVVASQAIKNLRYLTLGNVDRPHTDYWGEEWKDSPHTAPRIRLPLGRVPGPEPRSGRTSTAASSPTPTGARCGWWQVLPCRSRNFVRNCRRTTRRHTPPRRTSCSPACGAPRSNAAYVFACFAPVALRHAAARSGRTLCRPENQEPTESATGA
ncbi:hypothetical protein JM654_16540 [Microbacterium oxydans]|nr:hypothetical protein [Microbacterium oxydans]